MAPGQKQEIPQEIPQESPQALYNTNISKH